MCFLKPITLYSHFQMRTFEFSNMNTIFNIVSIQGTWEITECCVRDSAKISGELHASQKKQEVRLTLQKED